MKLHLQKSCVVVFYSFSMRSTDRPGLLCSTLISLCIFGLSQFHCHHPSLFISYSPLVIPLPPEASTHCSHLYTDHPEVHISLPRLTCIYLLHLFTWGSHGHLKLNIYKTDFILFLSNLPSLLYILVITLHPSIACTGSLNPSPSCFLILNLPQSCHGSALQMPLRSVLFISNP